MAFGPQWHHFLRFSCEQCFAAFSGPNSIAKCVVESEVDGRRRVRYIPVEVGIYTISVKWNGKEIEGSLFSTTVVCLCICDTWQRY